MKSNSKSKYKTKLQHYIPRFLLRRFLSPKSFRIYNKETGTYSNKGASNSMVKSLFYEHDKFNPNEIENLLQKRETVYAPIIAKLIKGEEITIKEYDILLEFRHVSHYRSHEFFAFHTYQKRRGDSSYEQRHDWKSMHGLYGPRSQEQLESDIKLSQLKAIKSVIANDEGWGNIIRKVSGYTPICLVYESKGTKFIIGDSGSLTIGGELEGITWIVISPTKVLAFPRGSSAIKFIEHLTKLNGKMKVPIIINYKLPEESVILLNEQLKHISFQYYVDPNLP